MKIFQKVKYAVNSIIIFTSLSIILMYEKKLYNNKNIF